MTSSTSAMSEAPPTRALLLPLLALGWVVAPLWLAFAAAITAAPFFGETPTAAEQASSTRLFLAAGACAVALPLVGALLAKSLRWRKTTIAFWVATTIGVLAVAALGVLMLSPTA